MYVSFGLYIIYSLIQAARKPQIESWKCLTNLIMKSIVLWETIENVMET